MKNVSTATRKLSTLRDASKESTTLTSLETRQFRENSANVVAMSAVGSGRQRATITREEAVHLAMLRTG